MTSSFAFEFNNPTAYTWHTQTKEILGSDVEVMLWVSPKISKQYYYIRSCGPKHTETNSPVYSIHQEKFNEPITPSANYCNNCRTYPDNYYRSKMTHCSQCNAYVAKLTVSSELATLSLNSGLHILVSDIALDEKKAAKLVLKLVGSAYAPLYTAAQYSGISKMFNSEIGSDIVLISKWGPLKSEVKANPEEDSTKEKKTNKLFGHRAILANCTNYFSHIFESGLEESNSAEVFIESCSFECLKAIIYFVYTQDIQSELVIFADFELWSEIITTSLKWGLLKLAKLAVVFASLYVTPENSLTLLNYCKETKEHGEVHKLALSYITNNWTSITD